MSIHASDIWKFVRGQMRPTFRSKFRTAWDSFSDWLSGVIPSIANRITGAGLTGAEREANDFTAGQTQAQMDFQERMANTQWQRGVEDMQAAGLNPALAYNQGGAVAPSGASGSSVSPTGGMSMSDLVALMTIKPQVELLKAEAAKTRAEGEKVSKEVGWFDILQQANLNQISAAIRHLNSESNLNENERKALLVAQEVAEKNQAALQDKEAFYQEWKNRYIAETGIDPSSSLLTNVFDSIMNAITSSLEALFPKQFLFTFNNMDPAFSYKKD